MYRVSTDIQPRTFAGSITHAHLQYDQIIARAETARQLASPCRLCPRKCGVDRNAGERGYCGAGARPQVAAVLPHFGEEPPLSGNGGAGTIFFSRCNMRCVYCQNHRISQGAAGSETCPGDLAARMVRLQEQECTNIEPVSPSHQLPAFLDALAMAVRAGLNLPLVYNTNGYESLETLDLLEGLVDVYLPDLKYSDPEAARKYSDAPDYVETARGAILKMHSQVGNLVTDIHGHAVRGTIVRHLVLPADASGTAETLMWIRANFPPSVSLSLMSQYAPLNRSSQFPEINRFLKAEDYEKAVDLAWDLGLENVFIQEMDSAETGIPDFDETTPFRWD